MLNIKDLLNELNLVECRNTIINNGLYNDCEIYDIVCNIADSNCILEDNKAELKKWASENMNAMFEYFDIVHNNYSSLEECIVMVQYNKILNDLWDSLTDVIVAYMLKYIMEKCNVTSIDKDIYEKLYNKAKEYTPISETRIETIYEYVDSLFENNWIGIDVKQETLDCGEFGKYFLDYTEGSIDDIMNEIADNNVDIYNDDLKLYLNNNFDKVNEYLQNYKIEFSDDYSLFDGIQAVQYSHIMENLDKHFKDSMLYLVLDYYSCTHDTQLIDENLLTNFENSIVEIINNNDVQSTNIKQYYNIVNNVL